MTSRTTELDRLRSKVAMRRFRKRQAGMLPPLQPPAKATEQQALALMVPEVAGVKGKAGKRITEPAEILRVAEQLGLFGACPDEGEP